MGDQGKNILIGLFVLAAFSITIFMLLFLHPSVGDQGKKLRIRFADIDKITIGTRVLYGGKPVGEVRNIKEIDNPEHPRQAINGFIYIYEIEANVDSTVKIFNSDEISAKTSGLLGEKSVSITPMPPHPGVTLKEIDTEVLYANESGSVEETLKELKGVADRFEDTLNAVNIFFTEINNSKLVHSLAGTANNIYEISDALNDQKLIKNTLKNVHTVSENAVDTVDTLNKTIADVQVVVGRTAKGEGSVGKILVKDDLYLKINSILSKVETLMDDVNHYGILFNSDRNWQRLRARRANLLYTLETPQEFRNFFNDEMDQISTSLSRVNTVLEETGDNGCFEAMIENGEFKKALAELIRRVKMMEENIRLYNTQLMEIDRLQTELCP